MLKYEDKWESYYRLEFEKVLESMENFEKGKYFFTIKMYDQLIWKWYSMLKYEDNWESYYKLKFEKVWESMRKHEKVKYFLK